MTISFLDILQTVTQMSSGRISVMTKGVFHMTEFLEKLQIVLQKYLDPFTQKLMSNKIVSAISTSMMKMMPIFIGGAVFSLIGNFPITAFTNWLTSIGIKPLIDSLVDTQTNLNPLIICFIIAYTYVKNEKFDGLIGGVFALFFYFLVIPATIGSGETAVAGYAISYFGGTAIFSGMIIGIIVGVLYSWIMKKHLVFKMPESVPAFVSSSFEPIYAGVIIFGLALIIKGLFSMTPYGDMFTAVYEIIQTPIVTVGASIPFMIFIYTLCNLLWFFGIHPTAVMSLYSPVLSTILAGNVRAAMAGEALPYFKEALAYMSSTIGGTGCTLGLVLCIVLFAKSKRYKQMKTIGAVPCLFNVNEPLMFGIPMIMNPVYLIPMLVVPAVNIGIMTIVSNTGVLSSYSAMVAVTSPWTMPTIITAFLAGGIPLFLTIAGIILVDACLFYPFFIVADRSAVKEETELEASELNHTQDTAV